MSDRLAAMRLLAADRALGGLWLRGPPGPERDTLLDALRAALPADVPLRTMPPGIDDDRLLGGIDLAASLAAGAPVRSPGLIEEAGGGILLIPGAERVSPPTAGRLAAALDRGEIALILLDEGAEDEAPPAALTERVAFHLSSSRRSPA